MATKLTDKCLQKVSDIEPIFTLRAQDRFASVLVRLWSDLAELHGAPAETIKEARDCATQMEGWPTKKWPD